jgi:hypothetical protein
MAGLILPPLTFALYPVETHSFRVLQITGFVFASLLAWCAVYTRAEPTMVRVAFIVMALIFLTTLQVYRLS